MESTGIETFSVLKKLTGVVSDRDRARRLTVFLATFAAALVLAPTASEARHRHGTSAGGVPFTMYRYPIAAAGSCMPTPRGSASSILNENGIGVRGAATSAELSSLAKGINQIQRLLGHPLPRSWRTSFNFISTAGHAKWNQGANAINVRRPRGSGKGNNVARMMHELGHRVGNSGAYAQYTRATHGQLCPITGYAASKRNEQFAEVFSAYVTYPDLLARRCPAAYHFFSERLFPGSASKVASCSSSSPATRPALAVQRMADLRDRDRRSTYISTTPSSRYGVRSENGSSEGVR